jgi:hypothetical protein
LCLEEDDGFGSGQSLGNLVWFDTPSPTLYNPRPCGAVAQLGERLNGIQEVVGSIPIGSTIFPFLKNSSLLTRRYDQYRLA